MELTPGVIIIVAVVVVIGFVLIRRAGRHEAAAPLDAPVTPLVANTMARDERANQPLVNWLLDRAFEQTGVPVANDALARTRIVEAAAMAMDELRAGGSASISLPFLVADASGPKHFDVRFKRNVDTTFEVVR